MLNICLKSKKKLNINASRVMERLERMYILGGQNNESVNSAATNSINQAEVQ